MKKIVLLIIFCLFSTTAIAKKTTYIYTNNSFNFVKIEEMDKKEAENLAPTHPFTFTVDQMRAILKEVKLNHSFVVKKEVEVQDIFDDHAIDLLAPNLVEAFSKAGANDKISFSYLTKDPQFFMRNDRLTIAYAWVHGKELHIEFEKMMAKLTGDYDKRGDFSKVVARSRGLRVSLDVRDGQMLGESSTKELVINTAHDFTKLAEETVEATNTSEIPPSTPLKKGGKGGFETSEVKATTVLPSEQATNDEPRTTTKDRLKELDDLKADGLITEKEYKIKRKEILKGL